MKKPAVFLSFVQKYPYVITWVLIYLTFFLVSASRQSFGTALFMSNTTMLPMIITWALTRYLLIPKLLSHHRGWYFFSCLMILTVISTIATETDLRGFINLYEQGRISLAERVENEIRTSGQTNSGRAFIHTKYIFLLLSTMAVTTVSWLLDERKRLSRQTKDTRTQLELKYLRAQMNPHFLFNALNCIYSLTMIKDEKAPDSVLKLSEMMRYVTDDCRADEVPLQKEITYIRNYIDFYKIRMEAEPNIVFECNIDNPSHMIPPMIFQPMVENCFKHSRIVDHPDGYIHIHLVQHGKKVTFIAENSKPKLESLTPDNERIGIGLFNVQQRLEMLFANRYTLDAEDDKQKYRIELCIKY